MAALFLLAKKLSQVLWSSEQPPPPSLAYPTDMFDWNKPLKIGVDLQSRRTIGETISVTVQDFYKTLERAPKSEDEDLLREIWDNGYHHSKLLKDAKLITTEPEKEALKIIESDAFKCDLFHSYVDNLGPLGDGKCEDLYPTTKTPIGALLWSSLSFLYGKSMRQDWILERIGPNVREAVFEVCKPFPKFLQPSFSVSKPLKRVFSVKTMLSLHRFIAVSLPHMHRFVLQTEVKCSTDLHFSAQLDEGVATLFCRLLKFFDSLLGLYIDISASKDHNAERLNIFATSLQAQFDAMTRMVRLQCISIDSAISATTALCQPFMTEADAPAIANGDQSISQFRAELKFNALNRLKFRCPEIGPHHINLISRLMRDYADHDDHANELKYIQEVYNDRVSRLGKLNALTVWTIHIVAHCQLAAGFVDESITTIRTYANRQTRLLGTPVVSCAGYLNHATIMSNHNIYLKAEMLLHEAITRLEVYNEGLNPVALEIAHKLCTIFLSTGKWQSGCTFASGWVDKCTASFEKKNKDTLTFLSQLGVFHHLEHNFDSSITTQHEAVTGLLDVVGDKEVVTQKAMTSLACTLFTQRNWTDAIYWYKRLLAIHHRDLGPSHRLSLRGLISLGSTQAAGGLLKAAQETFYIGLSLTLSDQGDLKNQMTACLVDIEARTKDPTSYRTPASYTLAGQLIREYSARGLYEDAYTLAKQAFLTAYGTEREGEECQSYRSTLARVLRELVKTRYNECVNLHKEGLAESIRINDVCEETLRWRWWLGWVLCNAGDENIVKQGIREILKALWEARSVLGREHKLVVEIVEFLTDLEEEDDKDEGEQGKKDENNEEKGEADGTAV